MIWTEEHVERTKPLFPKPRDTMAIDNLIFLRTLQPIDIKGIKALALQSVQTECSKMIHCC